MEKLPVTVVVVRTATFREADVNYTETPTATHLQTDVGKIHIENRRRAEYTPVWLQTVGTAGLTERLNYFIH